MCTTLPLTSNPVDSECEIGASVDKSIGHSALIETSIHEANTAHLQEGLDKGDPRLHYHLFIDGHSAVVFESESIERPRDAWHRETSSNTHGYHSC